LGGNIFGILGMGKMLLLIGKNRNKGEGLVMNICDTGIKPGDFDFTRRSQKTTPRMEYKVFTFILT
jgi:hypothetical protein